MKLEVEGMSCDGCEEKVEELRVAYARGDLSKEEFEERRENLTK